MKWEKNHSYPYQVGWDEKIRRWRAFFDTGETRGGVSLHRHLGASRRRKDAKAICTNHAKALTNKEEN